MRKDACGLTLLELLIALGVLAVLLAVALPAWTHASAAVHSSHAREELSATLFDAARHSTLTGRRVVVCSTAGGEQCADSVDWSQGWIAFRDENRDGVRGPDERVVRRGGPLHETVGLQSTRGRTRLAFHRFGRVAGSNVTFTLCDGRGPEHARTLVVANHGRLRVGEPTATAATSCDASRR